MYILPFKQFILTEKKRRKKLKRPSFLDVLKNKPDAEPDAKNDTPKPKMLKISLEI